MQEFGSKAAREDTTMTREDAKAQAKKMLPEYLRMKGINIRQNFRCLNPDHQDNNPSMSYDRETDHVHCFACGANYDIFDLVGIDYGLSEDRDKFNKAYELLGLPIDSPQQGGRNTGSRAGQNTKQGQAQKPAQPQGQYRNPAETEQNTILHTQEQQHNTDTQYTIQNIEPAPHIDLTAELEEAHRNLLNNPDALEHFKGRGLSQGIIERYRLGYAPAGHNSLLKAHPQNQSKSRKDGLYKYIFPYFNEKGRATYFISEISDRTQIDDYNGKYRKLNKGNTPETSIAAEIFNERYLRQAPGAIFICEGIFDALSVEEAGGNAIAIMGTGQKRLLSLCKQYRPDTVFIVSLDNDNAGQQAAGKITEGLDYLQIPYIVKAAASGKDLNDSLRADRQAFVAFVKQTEQEAADRKKQIEQEAVAAYQENNAAHHLQGFIDSIEKSKTASYYPTGFSSLDALIDGGLYAGLYCIGAISSLGKTSFCLQVMDNIAAAGHDVIIFSLEMSQYELMAKTISRHTLLEDLQQNGTTVHAKTTRGITTGKRYRNYTADERNIIAAAVKAYSQYADHIYIKEGVGNIGVRQIREAVEEHIRVTKNIPVLLVDYLQILAPLEERMTDKQATDRNILELKRLSRDYSIPVIGISSFNRDNYTDPVNMAAFKESGAIEYSSDVLIGLQYFGMDWQPGESEKARNSRIRELMKSLLLNGKRGKPQEIQIKVLKNRNGSKGETCIDYIPMFNFFAEKNSEAGMAAAAARGAIDGSDQEEDWMTVTSTDTGLPFDEGI